jgi:membrane fusion protein (multidrug efflux system)
MWVYFSVSEARYLEYKRREGKSQNPSGLQLTDSRIELGLADGSTFDHNAGNIVTVESTVNRETGSIFFRADFPNPDGLLRHGQTGTVLIRRTVKKALIIPRRAAFENLDGHSVCVVGDGGVVHPREVVVQHELDDLLVIGKGLGVNDKIVVEGGSRLRDGDKVEFEYQRPEAAIGRPKNTRGK